jgi:hypothetical protein
MAIIYDRRFAEGHDLQRQGIQAEIKLCAGAGWSSHTVLSL